MTNADRIRAMSDKELCRFLMGGGVCEAKYGNTFCNSAECSCNECTWDWLQEEITVDGTQNSRLGWIRIDDRLPEERGYPPVICGHNEDGWTDAAIVTVRGKFINSDGCEIFPTHWMQLPNPPSREPTP